MWSDNETDIDLLRYAYLASGVVRIVKSEYLLPTVGVFGDWGSGKSSLLRMIQMKLDKDPDVLCLTFDGWLFEGYDDAKTALIGTILDAIQNRVEGNQTRCRSAERGSVGRKGLSFGVYVPVYVGAQFLGGILGAVGTWIAYGSAAREVALLATTFPPDDVGVLRALVVEILIAFILVFVVISVATDDRVPAGVAPLAVGFALACGVLIAGPVTGGSVNPARTLGPALVAGDFNAIWVYIVGPIAGGVLAALLYDNFISEAETPD